jgi:dienelactone hydrolase
VPKRGRSRIRSKTVRILSHLLRKVAGDNRESRLTGAAYRRIMWSMRIQSIILTLATAVALAPLAGCASSLSSKAGVYTARRQPILLADRKLNLTYATPEKPRSPVFLILFATGDAGWFGVSGSIVEHLAEEGCYVTAYDSRELLAMTKRLGKKESIADAAAAVETIIARSRRDLGLPETTPVIVTGFSRGANMVVFTVAAKSLQRELAGAIAIALTREMDYLLAPSPSELPPSVETDEQGRIQTYPAIARAGSLPVAVIQSKGDKYVRAEESRRLFGPDSPTRRLYQVDARNHGFDGGKAEMLRDLDEALAWIEDHIFAFYRQICSDRVAAGHGTEYLDARMGTAGGISL